LAKFGSFEQFWADFVAMAMANSMPSFERKKIKHFNLWENCQNLECNNLVGKPFEFHIYQKIFKESAHKLELQ
jgi:hypothetical protein